MILFIRVRGQKLEIDLESLRTYSTEDNILYSVEIKGYGMERNEGPYLLLITFDINDIGSESMDGTCKTYS